VIRISLPGRPDIVPDCFVLAQAPHLLASSGIIQSGSEHWMRQHVLAFLGCLPGCQWAATDGFLSENQRKNRNGNVAGRHTDDT
jgi:hypothetical protein